MRASAGGREERRSIASNGQNEEGERRIACNGQNEDGGVSLKLKIKSGHQESLSVPLVL